MRSECRWVLPIHPWTNSGTQALCRCAGLLQIHVASLKSKGQTVTPEAEKELLDKITNQYNEQLSPYYAAARLWTDGIIDPLETRRAISMGIEAANHAPIEKRYNVGVIQT